MNSMAHNPPIAILTDFGNGDPFVGIMKGVILTIAPQARLIDISHDIPPGDIKRGAVMLWQSLKYFPEGTIFLSVVDPGVGTSRQGMILQSGPYKFVGPDNGLFSFILKNKIEAWELVNPKFQLPSPGSTFHGRDIFAPAAAHAANGIQGSRFGPPISEIVELFPPRLEVKPDRIEGEVLYADRFGNLLTSLGEWIPSERENYKLEPWLAISAALEKEIYITKNQASVILPDGRTLTFVDTFSDIPDGECGMLVGSSGLVEIAANRNRALDLLSLSSGDPITLEY